MSKRNGGKPTDRTITNDIYFDEHAAKWMIDWLECNEFLKADSQNIILDACSGTYKQPLGRAMSKYGRVDHVDKNMDTIKKKSHPGSYYEANILNWNPAVRYNYIICNPPWSPVEQAEEIYHHLLNLLLWHGTLFFIINYSFINTNWKRGGRLGMGLQIALPRYLFAKSQKENDPNSNGLLDPWLLINRQRMDDPPFFCPIPPELCKTNQKLLPMEVLAIDNSCYATTDKYFKD